MLKAFKKRWRSRVSARSVPSVHRDAIKADWSAHGYYARAEEKDWLAPFWADSSPFLERFKALDLACVVEIGCGQGRHAAQFVERAGRIYLTDINETNIDACKRRYAGQSNVTCLQTGGSDVGGIPDGVAWRFSPMTPWCISRRLTW